MSIFSSLGEKLNHVFSKLTKRGKLTELEIKEAMREIRIALLEADVSLPVVKSFIASVSEKATGETILKSLTPAQQVIKIVNEELIALMGSTNSKLEVSPKLPTVIMMCGLQGAGKTTFCGKLAICNVLRQEGVPYTLTADFAVAPRSRAFAADIRRFAAICRIVKGLGNFNVGVIGARTTPFKTVRIDEIAFQRRGVNVETLDLADIFKLMRVADAKAVAAKHKELEVYARRAPCCAKRIDALARLGVAIDGIISDYGLDSVAVRCWDEFQTEWGISPCVVMSMLNDRGFPAACETDVDIAVMMRAVGLAAGEGEPIAVFDVNNNYRNAKDKAIFFHCSAVPRGMLTGKGVIDDHPILAKSMGPDTSVGVHNGKMRPGPITVASLRTEDGRLKGFVTEGDVTMLNLGKGFFGTGFVFRKADEDMNGLFNYMAENGYRHHVAFAYGLNATVVREALVKYLGYEIDLM